MGRCLLRKDIPEYTRTIKVRVPDVHEVDALAGEARRDLLPFLLDVEHERQKALDVRERHVIAVGALDKGLALQIEDGDEGGHGQGRYCWGCAGARVLRVDDHHWHASST